MTLWCEQQHRLQIIIITTTIDKQLQLNPLLVDETLACTSTIFCTKDVPIQKINTSICVFNLLTQAVSILILFSSLATHVILAFAVSGHTHFL
jgi:hypothetical protein